MGIIRNVDECDVGTESQTSITTKNMLSYFLLIDYLDVSCQWCTIWCEAKLWIVNMWLIGILSVIVPRIPLLSRECAQHLFLSEFKNNSVHDVSCVVRTRSIFVPFSPFIRFIFFFCRWFWLIHVSVSRSNNKINSYFDWRYINLNWDFG